MVWSEHRRVNIDVFGRRLILEERRGSMPLSRSI